MHAMPDADDKAETTGASCRHAGRGVLENRDARWNHPKSARPFQEHVRSRLPSEAQIVEIDAINSCIEVRRQAGSTQDFCTMVTGRRNGRAHAPVSSIAEKDHGGVEHLHALARQKLEEIVIFSASNAMNSLLFRPIPGSPMGRLIPRAAIKPSTPPTRGLPST